MVFCCKCGKPSNIVAPLSLQNDSYRLVKLRSNRVVCVHHFNIRDRDPDFEKRMQKYVKQHFYGADFRTTSLPSYKDACVFSSEDNNRTHLTEQHGKAVPFNSPGESEKATLFMFHGVGGSADVFKAQIEYFTSQGHEVIAPDLIGHGYSPAPKKKSEYVFKEILLDIYIIFDMYCKQHNIVIGHSYGASFAAALARRRPHLVQKLVMMSGGAPTPLAPQPGIFSVPLCTLACLKPIVKRGFYKNAFYAGSLVVDKERAFNVSSYVLKYIMNGQWWPEGNAEYHEWISVPTLLLHGRDDRLIGIEEEEEMLDVIFGSVLKVIDDASHMLMMEQPDDVNQALRTFILAGSENTMTTDVTADASPASTPRQRSHTNDEAKLHAHAETDRTATEEGNGATAAKLDRSPRNSGRPVSARKLRTKSAAKSIPSGLVSANFTNKNT